MCSNLPELGEGLVCLKTLRNALGALCTELVATQTAIESKTQTSGGADGREMMCGSVHKPCEGLVCFKALG